MIRTTIRHWLLHTAIDHLFSTMHRLLVSPKEEKQFVLDKMYDSITVKPNGLKDTVTILDAYYTGWVMCGDGHPLHMFTSDRLVCNKAVAFNAQMWCNTYGNVSTIMNESIISFDYPIEFYIHPGELL